MLIMCWRARFLACLFILLATSAGIAASHGATSRVVLAEGDSITSTNGPDEISYADDFITGIGLNYFKVLYNKAVTSSTLADIEARAPVDNALLNGTARSTYTLLTGANDLASYPGASDAIAAANYTAALFSFAASQHAAGWRYVCIITILPRANVTHNIRRAIVNVNLLAAVGNQIDCAPNFGGDNVMGADDSFDLYPQYWNDSTHPNTLGHFTRLLPLYSAGVIALP